MKKILLDLHEKYIKGTREKAIVENRTISICRLTNTVFQEVIKEFDKESRIDPKIYINTKAFKHLYDKKPAEEFDFLVHNLHRVIKYPNCIYKNKDPKRGHICLIKSLEGNNYFCSLENDGCRLFVVTAFKIRKDNYLKDYEFLWEWRSDNPSS